MRQLDPDSPAAIKRYEALKRRWRTATMAGRTLAVAVVAAGLGGVGAGTYVAFKAVPQTTITYQGSVAAADPLPSDTPVPTDTPTVAPTPIPTDVPVALPTGAIAGPALPTPIPLPAATPATTPLWSGSGRGNFTSPTFSLPNINGDMRWSFRCDSTSGDFQVTSYDPVGVPQSAGGSPVYNSASGEGEGTISSRDGVFVRVMAPDACLWTVSVDG